MGMNHGYANTVHPHCAMMGHPAFPLLSRGSRTRPDQTRPEPEALHSTPRAAIYSGALLTTRRPGKARTISRSNIYRRFSESGADAPQGGGEQSVSFRLVYLQGSSMCLVPTEWLWLDGRGGHLWEVRCPPPSPPSLQRPVPAPRIF